MTGLGRKGALALLTLAIIAPLVPVVLWSFARVWAFPDLLPRGWSLDAWAYVFGPSSQVLPATLDSLKVALPVTALSLLVAVPAGRALGMHAFPGKGLAAGLVLAPNIVPGLTVALGLQAVFIRLGLDGTVAGVVLVHLSASASYAVLVMAGVFATYDAEAEEAARSLGATPAQVFRHVTLPAIKPGLVVAGLFAFLVSWDQYVTTLLVAGGQVRTLSVLVVAAAGGSDRAAAGALAVVFLLPAVLVLLLAARALASGTGLAGVRR